MHVDEESRTVGAEPDAVWQALTDPDHVVQWRPPKEMTGDLETYDVRCRRHRYARLSKTFFSMAS